MTKNVPTRERCKTVIPWLHKPLELIKVAGEGQESAHNYFGYLRYLGLWGGLKYG
jgi:hypothetical protein